MTIGELLAEAFGRIHGVVLGAVRGLSEEELAFRPEGRCNSIAWLVWHLTRIQDDHVAAAAGNEQAWMAEGWADRFGLPFSPAETGYGHTSAEVAAVRAPPTCWSGTTKPCMRTRSSTCRAWARRTWTAWWTLTGIRRSPWGSGWSA